MVTMGPLGEASDCELRVWGIAQAAQALIRTQFAVLFFQGAAQTERCLKFFNSTNVGT